MNKDEIEKRLSYRERLMNMVSLFVVVLLTIGDSVLLVRRAKQSFGKGLYSLVGGKVEAGETARQAIKREVAEETALLIPEESFELVHTLHRKGTETEFIALCFKVSIAAFPEPYNNEPDKHDDMRFFPLNQLPANMLPAHQSLLAALLNKQSYSEHGW